jgi:hypothetical protein
MAEIQCARSRTTKSRQQKESSICATGVNSSGVTPCIRPASRKNFRIPDSRPSLRDEAIAFATLWDTNNYWHFELNGPLKECTRTFLQITLILLPANKWVFFSYK